MYFAYGSYQHTANEVNVLRFQKQLKFNARNQPERILATMNLRVEMQASSQAAIDAKIAALEAAYSVQYQNAGLFTDAGAATQHYLQNSTSLTGVRVTNISYDESDGSQFATARTAFITLEAEYPAGNAPATVDWQEQVRIIGTGGPRFTFVETLVGPPRGQILTQQTAVQAVQSGQSIGYYNYIGAPPPLFPQYEMQDRRDIGTGSPSWDGNRFTNWPTYWSYYFMSDQPLAGIASRRS